MDTNYTNESFIFEILNNWKEFTKFNNEDNKIINLNSWEYTFNRYNEKISTLVETYNIPSEITIVYLKNLFGWYLKKASITFYDLFNNNIELLNIKKLFELFNDKRIKQFEDSFYNVLDYISAKMIKNNLIGKLDYSKIVENSLDIIFDELLKCRLEIYQKGKNIENINVINQNIYFFDTLVECLSVLQNYEDAIYICYISNHNTSDGYFGFFIKNNENIFSINERIPEAFIGQHQNGRNHRFIEGKPSGIFPYELFNFSNYDYKGYAKTYTLKNNDNKNILLSDLSHDSYTTLLIIVFLLKCRFENKELEGDIVYSNFYLSNNILSLKESNKNELMVISNNQIVNTGENTLNKIINKITTEDILSGKFNDDFNIKLHPELKYHEYGYFGNNIFIDLYAEGFVFNPTKILVDNSLKLLSNKDAIINAEFVGTEKEMFLQIYQDARWQLANYIKLQMNKEYEVFKKEFGSVRQWWNKKLDENTEKIRKFVIQSYIDAKNENALVHATGWRRLDSNISVYFNENNNAYRNNIDFYNGKPCNCKIVVNITDWKDIKNLIGEEIPKIIMGYTENRQEPGNCLLNVVDPVLRIRTPFEQKGSFSYNFDRYDFPIIIYCSKSGLKKYIKDNKLIPKNNSKIETTKKGVTICL